MAFATVTHAFGGAMLLMFAAAFFEGRRMRDGSVVFASAGGFLITVALFIWGPQP